MKKRFAKCLSLLLAGAILMLVFTGCSGESNFASDAAAGNFYYATQETYYEEYDEPYFDDVEHNTEEYDSIKENRFLSVAANPFSTFSADVDTASYANIRRFLNSNSRPDEGAVRIEEMLNYFYYDYPEPTGSQPFSVTTELSDCPWNADTKLMMIGLQAKKLDKEALPDSNLVFLIDVSGSMDSNDKLPLVKQAFSILTEQLGDNDRISIVTYASHDDVVISGATGQEKQTIMDAVYQLDAYGSTDGSSGIITAYELAERYFIKGGNNRVILATDGDFNVGVSSESELERLIEKKRESGVFLSVMGFGTGNIKDNKMETLADCGNGNYYYIDSPSEARKVLINELGGTLFTVAKDVKLQVEFNPAFIKGYRLIGYENRVMSAEDFADDKKDAGEIGAGHRVTALYEIVDNDSPFEIDAPDSVYQNNSGNSGDSDGGYLTLNIRYKQPDGDTSELLTYPVDGDSYKSSMSDNMIFASVVAQFGMLLRFSEYAGSSTYEGILETLDANPRVLNDEYRREFYELVEIAKVICR